MSNDNFFKNSFFLTAANLTTGVLGFIFSIYLSNLIGPEGIGLYGLIMPIYNLFISLMTAGIVAAISQRSAIYSSKGEYNNLFKTIKTVAFFNIIWSVAIGFIVFFLASYISEFGVKDIRTINAIRVTCPAMVFIALSNIFKGYFYGISKITVPAFIDILEKALRILTIALLIFLFKAQSLSSLVTLAYVSLAIGELQSLLLLYVYYKHLAKKMPISYEKPERRGQLLFNVLLISLPLCLNGFLGNIFSTFSTLIVPRRLVSIGYEYSTAIGMIGKFNGMALTIVTFPMIVIGSINMLLMPDLSETLSRGNYYDASVRIKKVLKLAFLLGLATTTACLIIPDSLSQMFYNRSDLGNYIKICAISAPIFFVSNSMFGILNGLNRQSIILRNSILLSCIELLSLYVLVGIPEINVCATAITIAITSSIGLCLNLYEVKKHIDINISVIDIIIFLLLALLTYLSLNLLSNTLLKDLFILKNIIILILTFGAFAYFSRFGTREDF